MRKPITIIKAPNTNGSFEDDRFSDRVSDRQSLPERLSDRLSIGDTKLELTRQSLDRLRTLTFKKIVKNLSLCGDEHLSNNTFDDYMSCHTENHGLLLNPSIIHLFKNEKDLLEFMQDQKSKYEMAVQQKQDRQMKIQRYKNKRRNWQPQISYGCRKRVAESRLRIKGRFISKRDTATISELAHQSDVDQLFDAKRNLDILKFQSQTQIFRGFSNPKEISKRQILRTIRDEAEFKQQQEQIKKRIQEQMPIWTINKPKRRNHRLNNIQL